MKPGAFVATLIAIGLIAYGQQPSLLVGEQKTSLSVFPSTQELKTHLLSHSQFASVAVISSSDETIELQIPADSLFFKNSTALSPEADRQFSELVKYFNSFDATSTFEVSVFGLAETGYNSKFRSTRARKLAEVIKKAGISEQRIAKVWQVVLDEPGAREIASEAGPSASFDFVKNQYFTVIIRTVDRSGH